MVFETQLIWKNSLSRKTKAEVILKTGRFDNIDSVVIISSVDKAVQNWVNSWTCVVETCSYKIIAYCSYIIAP